jgi:hypothetical protein
MKTKKIISAVVAAAMILTMAMLAPAGADPSHFIFDEYGTLVGYTGPGGDIIIPETVRWVSAGAFGDFTTITSIFIPDNSHLFPGDIFLRCTNLTAINVSEENPYYTSVDGVWFNKDMTNIIRYPIGKKETEYIIPDGVKIIFGMPGVKPESGGAFSGCVNLESVLIPDSVTAIGRHAFSGCTNLTGIEIPKNVIEIDNYAFKSTGLKSITIPESVIRIGYETFSDCMDLTSITFKSKTPPNFRSRAFHGSDNLTAIYVPEGAKAAYEAAEGDSLFYAEYIFDGIDIIEICSLCFAKTCECIHFLVGGNAEALAKINLMGGITINGVFEENIDPNKLQLSVNKITPQNTPEFFTALKKYLSTGE